MIVLGDRVTVRNFDVVVEAARRGAVIVDTFSFDAADALAAADLTEIDAVVTALSRAISSRTDIWMPLPTEDFGREQHARRVSLLLQRHGLNLLMGPELTPCTLDAGYSEIDLALRREVKAVDELGNAVLARAGMRTLGVEIEVELTQRAEPPAEIPAEPAPDDPPEPDGIGEKVYSTGEIGKFLGKTGHWVHAGLQSGVLAHSDGSPIEAILVGHGRRRRFTLPAVRAMALSCYRQGVVGEDELLDLLAVLGRAEQE